MTERLPFAHRALLALEGGADRRAPGGAVTLAPCGAWEHPPPCPLAPHRTDVYGPDDRLEVRVFFVASPADETEVRRRIERALAAGAAPRPECDVARWRLLEHGAASLDDEERAAVLRLAP